MKKGKLKDDIERRPHIQAAKHDQSKAGSVGEVFRAKLTECDPPASLAESVRARFAPLGGIELELPPRDPMREPPDFE